MPLSLLVMWPHPAFPVGALLCPLLDEPSFSTWHCSSLSLCPRAFAHSGLSTWNVPLPALATSISCSLLKFSVDVPSWQRLLWPVYWKWLLCNSHILCNIPISVSCLFIALGASFTHWFESSDLVHSGYWCIFKTTGLLHWSNMVECVWWMCVDLKGFRAEIQAQTVVLAFQWALSGYIWVLPWWLSGKESACQCRRSRVWSMS